MLPRRDLVLCLILAALLTPLNLAQKPASSAQTATTGGTTTTTFETSKGKIKVYLPDDMAAGDTISGTVTTEPSGKNDKEKQSNAATLNGYVVAVADQKSPISGGTVQRVYLAPNINATTLILMDEKGKQVGNSLLPLAPAPVIATTPDFVVRAVGQIGHPIQVYGPFDGDSANTNIKIGNVDSRIIAESPRKVVCESSSGVVGPTNIEVTENATTATGKFRNLKIDLTAPKTSLLKGESTELHVEVNGLQGLTNPIPVQIQNQSPSTINLTGGNTQTISIQPSQVQSTGNFQWSTGVTATGNGGFSITGSVPTGPYLSPAPPSTSPSPNPTPAPQPADTVMTRPAKEPMGSSDRIEIEMVQLDLKSSRPLTVPASPTPTPTDVPTGPTAPSAPSPTPSPEPTPPPRYVPTPAPLPPDTTPKIPGSGQPVIPRPTPTPTPKPLPLPTPTPSPTPCDCDLVTLLVPDPPGPNKVDVTKQDDVTDAAGNITGTKVLVTLKLVDHEIKCAGAASSEKCTATVKWSIASTSFKFNAKGKPWDGKEPKETKPEGDMKYLEMLKTTAAPQIDLEGSCDPKVTATKRTFTVSQVFTLTYPDELTSALKDAKANKPKKVEVGEITGSITWIAIAKNCKATKFLIGPRRIDPGGALITQFKISGGTYKF